MKETKLPLEHHLDLLSKTTPKFRFDGSMPLDEWKKQAYDRLYELLGMDKFEYVEPDIQIDSEIETDEYTEINFTFQSEASYRPLCRLLLPKGIEKPPVMISITGHSKGMHVLVGRAYYDNEDAEVYRKKPCRALQSVQHGYAALTIEQRGFGQRGGTKEGTACLQPAVTALLLGRTLIGERAWDISRAIDVLEKHFPNLDTSKIGLMGGSGGGTASFYTACIEPRITMVNASVSVCSFGESIAPLRHCMCNYIPRIAEYFDMGDLGGLISPRPFVMDNGINDTGFRIKGARESAELIKQAYEREGAGDKYVFIEGPEGHRFYDTLVWPELDRLAGE